MSGDNIDDLEKRVKDAQDDYRAEYEPGPDVDEKSISDGARAGVELVGAVIGGGLIGWGLDYFFGTSPILFLLFLILGVITGFYNIYKITQNIGTSVGFKPLHDQQKNAKQAAKHANPHDNDD